MSRAALVNVVLFWCVAGLTLLLVMFLFAVIAMPPEDAVPTEPPALKTSAPPPPLPARRPRATALPLTPRASGAAPVMRPGMPMPRSRSRRWSSGRRCPAGHRGAQRQSRPAWTYQPSSSFLRLSKDL